MATRRWELVITLLINDQHMAIVKLGNELIDTDNHTMVKTDEMDSFYLCCAVID